MIQGNSDRTPGTRKGPLAGIRVADFCWMGVGSMATRFLGDFGAEVIKIENRLRIDTPRRLPIYKGEVRAFGEEVSNPDPNKGGLHNNYSRNKLGITVNMKTPEGREIVERLIAASSVVTENFAPGVMERWGLTYERLQELSPEVIYARMSGFGHSGPYNDYRSYGPVVQAASGLSYISGLPGREPSGWGFSYMDNQAAYYNSAAMLMAIYQRNRTGKGTEIDVSAVEAGGHPRGPVLPGGAGHRPPPPARPPPHRHPIAHPPAPPPRGYPAAGGGRWGALAGFHRARRHGPAARAPAGGAPPEPRFATAEARRANADALDALLSGWTRTQDAQTVMVALQAAGVNAAAVQNPQDLNEVDPQLAARGIFFDMDHPVIGEARFEGEPMLFSRTSPDNWRSAPLLGEDNDYVYGELLGYSSEQIADFTERGII